MSGENECGPAFRPAALLTRRLEECFAAPRQPPSQGKQLHRSFSQARRRSFRQSCVL